MTYDSDSHERRSSGKTLVYLGAGLLVFGAGLQLAYALSTSNAPAPQTPGERDALEANGPPDPTVNTQGPGSEAPAPDDATFEQCATSERGVQLDAAVDPVTTPALCGDLREATLLVFAPPARPAPPTVAAQMRDIRAACTRIARACRGRSGTPPWAEGTDPITSFISAAQVPLDLWYPQLPGCAAQAIGAARELAPCADDLKATPSLCGSGSACELAYALANAEDDATTGKAPAKSGRSDAETSRPKQAFDAATLSARVTCVARGCEIIRTRCEYVEDPPAWFEGPPLLADDAPPDAGMMATVVKAASNNKKLSAACPSSH